MLIPESSDSGDMSIPPFTVFLPRFADGRVNKTVQAQSERG